jgi:TPR repeat protein
MHSNLLRIALLASFASLLPSPIFSQVYPNSPVFRGYRSEKDRRDPDDGLRRQINIFLLERDAANGDPLAQHELGVRLLTGNGVPADTVRCAHWLRSAAAQSLTPAMYNYALLLSNGWGVEWDPFAAYRLFRDAAERGMTEAQYVTGIFFTDNLVLRQNWDSAWAWIGKAALAGYEPALRAKREILDRGHIRVSADSTTIEKPAAGMHDDAGEDEARHARPATAWTPVLLDFQRDRKSLVPSTQLLFDELLASRAFTAADSLALGTLLADGADSAAWPALARMAAWGNPEAMVLLGRFHADGSHVPQNRMAAAALYVAAVFLESSRAPALLIELLEHSDLAAGLPSRAWSGDPQAQYVWACLKALDIDTRLTDSQALDLLKRAAAQRHPEAVVQLGICFSTGRWVEQDMRTAENLWKQAAALRQEEARLRLAAATVLGRSAAVDHATAFTVLEAGAREGSLLAQVVLASSYERGIGCDADLGEAARRYRDCAVRGSQTAWRSLQRMYDERRPADPAFRVD